MPFDLYFPPKPPLFAVSRPAIIRASAMPTLPSDARGIRMSPPLALGLGSSFAAMLVGGDLFSGGNVSKDSVYDACVFMATGAAATPTAGGTLTINGQSLGSYDYTIKDGNQTISSFTNSDWFTTTADSRSAFIVVKGDLTINSGQTLIPSNRKLFTVVYVAGNLAVAGGISMSARGANHSSTGSNITANAIRIITGTYSSVTNPQVPAAGANGGTGFSGTSPLANAGGNGSVGSGGATGGGGAGGASTNGVSVTAGNGSAGTAFSGGIGAGGVRASGSTNSSSNAGTNGGAASAGASNQGSIGAGGGAGNPGAAGAQGGSTGSSGSGGVLIVIALGALSGSGTMTSAGTNGGAGTGSSAGAGGGASGGGSITVLSGSDSSSITPTALGGTGGTADSAATGGNGGNGTARKLAL